MLALAAPAAGAGLCLVDKPAPLIPSGSGNEQTGAIEISADDAQVERDGMTVLNGNVIVLRDDQRLHADKASYARDTGLVEAFGNIRYWDDTVITTGSNARFNVESGQGVFENSDYWLADGLAHGHADVISAATDGQPTNLENPDYTTCPGSNPLWQLTADSVHLDHAADTGTARNTTIKIHGVPVLYSPWLTFPLSDKRKTGFLFPSFGQTGESGFEYSQPWYWNISPQRDATITPRYMEKRGLLLRGEYRYLRPRGSGSLSVEYLPNDGIRGDDRGAVGFSLIEKLGSHWSTDIGINYVSDKEYLEELGNGLSINSTTHLENHANLTWRKGMYYASARAQAYQTIDRNIARLDRPYERLPQLIFSVHPKEKNRQLNFRLDSELVNFERDNGVTGLRADIRPSASLPYRTLSGFVVPKLSVWHTRYDLDHLAAGDNNNPSRTVPVFSVDSGLFFERDVTWGQGSFLQTIEPRLFYLFKDKQGQDDIPDFDSSEFTFSFNQLFREDRFSGGDRVGDANQVSIALTSRILSRENGRELFRAGIGQTYYFRDREITLPGEAIETDDSSAIITEAIANITREWRVRGELQWDPHESRTEKSSLDLRYHPDTQRIINIGYRSRSGTSDVDVEQTDISFRWPLNQSWSVLGRWNWSLQDSRSLETFAGVEYDGCCTAFRVVGRRNINTATGEYNTGVFLQVELKGLSGFGSKTVSFLKRSIPGYQNEF